MRNGIPNLGALQAFEATARLGSFSRAAEELALTHSAVYRQVAGLEDRLGTTLFNRVRRRIVLTEAGAEYAGRVRRLLEQLQKDTFDLMTGAKPGRRLHLAVLPTLATTWLLLRLPGFQARYPEFALSLSARTIPFQFSDHPYDAAIYHAVQPWSQTQGIKLFDEEALVPVCAPSLLGHTASRCIKSRLRDLPHLHLISRPHAWRAWYRAQNLDYAPTMLSGPRYDLFSMALAAAEAGLGLALLPRFLAGSALDKGTVVQPYPGVLYVPEAYYFGYPEDQADNEGLILFQSWLQQEAQLLGA